MRKWTYVEIVVESAKQRDLGIKNLIFIKQAFAKEDVLEYRESVDDEGDVEPYTYVFTTQSEFCVNMTFENFKRFMEEEEPKDAEL